MGIKSQDLSDEQKIREKVKEVDDQFDLVMLADQFDESLILLAKKLCWKLEDLVTLKLNARSKTIKVRLQKGHKFSFYLAHHCTIWKTF